MNVVEVWRGLSVDRRSELDLARLRPGDRLSARRHPWWTVRPGVAMAYATTGEGVPVVIHAEIAMVDVPTTPCLPKLRGDEVIIVKRVRFP